MARPIAPAVALCTLAACVDLSPDIPPLFTCDTLGFGGLCVDADHPLDFGDEHVWLADDGAVALDYLALDGLVFTVGSDAPAVMTATLGADGTLTLNGVAPGLATLIARDVDGTIIGRVAIEVAPIAEVELRFDPAGDIALTELAALPGATERLRVIARDARGIDLAGAAPAVQLVTTGPLAPAALADAEFRAGSVTLFDPTVRPGFEAAVRFDALGAGTIAARVAGVELATLPVAVIPAATAVELRLAAPEAAVGWFQLVGLVGADARGVPVAGLVGDFTATPAALATVVDPHAGQAALRTLAPGVVTVTATLPDRTLTTTFTIVAP